MLSPFHKNFSKRITKTPKLYFYDSGLLSFLLKINDSEQLINQSVRGALFENMIVSEYFKQIYHNNMRQTDLWFWRDSEGNEVDLIKQTPDKTEIIEIKSTLTIVSDLFKGLNYYESLENDIPLAKKLIYSGSENQKRSAGEVISWRNIKL